jgi:hypothetical protein
MKNMEMKKEEIEKERINEANLLKKELDNDEIEYDIDDYKKELETLYENNYFPNKNDPENLLSIYRKLSENTKKDFGDWLFGMRNKLNIDGRIYKNEYEFIY